MQTIQVTDELSIEIPEPDDIERLPVITIKAMRPTYWYKMTVRGEEIESLVASLSEAAETLAELWKEVDLAERRRKEQDQREAIQQAEGTRREQDQREETTQARPQQIPRRPWHPSYPQAGHPMRPSQRQQFGPLGPGEPPPFKDDES